MEHLFVVVLGPCNLKCVYCWYVTDAAPIMPMKLRPVAFSSWVSQWREVSPIQSITFTGGEPYLRKDFEGFLDVAAEQRLETAVITNGTLLNEARVQKLRENNVAVHLSLDSVHEAHHEAVRGRHKETMRAAALLEEFDVPRRFITTVLTRGNIDEIPALRQFALDHGFRIKFQPADLPADQPLSLWNCSEQERTALGRALWSWASDSGRLAYAGLIMLSISRGVPPVPDCSFTRTSLVIDSDGSIYPCFQNQAESLGSIFTTSPGEVAQRRELLFQRIPPGSCFKAGCFGVF